ncbi:MAG: hypothetical protein J1F64_04590 [Oscillospiraceae bacterium]|nr:hypothetical protein [Oscillospiraceae bacterium]
MIPVIASVLFWVPVAALVIRVLGNSGMKLPDNRLIRFICADKRTYEPDGEAGGKELLAVFGLCIAFRLLMYLASFASLAFFSEEKLGFDMFLSHWRQWDVSNYIRIAEGGYSGYTEDGKFTTLAFFPLTSVFIRIFYLFLRNMNLAAMAEAVFAYGAGCVYLYGLMRMDYDKERAAGAVVLISIFPYALFFGTGMSESTFFAMSAAAMYYLRKGDMPMFAVFGVLTSLSRMVGIAVMCPAVVEVFERYDIIGKIRRKEKAGKILLKNIPPALAPCIGIPVYWLINYMVTGSAFTYLEYQRTVWHQGAMYFGKSTELIFGQIFGGSGNVALFGIWLPGILCYALIMIALAYGIRRHRSMYTVFFAACAMVNMSLKWPISAPRYTSALIPLFIVMSDFCENRKFLKQLVYAVSAALLGIYMTGYLFSKHIL